MLLPVRCRHRPVASRPTAVGFSVLIYLQPLRCPLSVSLRFISTTSVMAARV